MKYLLATYEHQTKTCHDSLDFRRESLKGELRAVRALNWDHNWMNWVNWDHNWVNWDHNFSICDSGLRSWMASDFPWELTSSHVELVDGLIALPIYFPNTFIISIAKATSVGYLGLFNLEYFLNCATWHQLVKRHTGNSFLSLPLVGGQEYGSHLGLDRVAHSNADWTSPFTHCA